MRYNWGVLFLFGSFIFCSNCGQSQKASETTAPAEKNFDKYDSIEANTSVAAPGKSSVAAALPQGISGKSDSLDFTEIFSLFFQTIQMEEAAKFNQYIHPAFGLYIIEQPGAMPKFTKVEAIQDFRREYQNQPFFSIRKDIRDCDLKQEALPAFNCDGNENNPAGFTKTGCFVAGADAYKKNEAHKYASLPSAEEQQIERLKPLLDKTILHTASGFRFHFSNLEGKWYVLFIELIVPCSA